MTPDAAREHPEGPEDPDLLALAPGPRCRRCGHMPCPMCPAWCDTFVPNPEDPDDSDPCCDTECDFDPLELERWKGAIAADLDLAYDADRSVTVAEGPFALLGWCNRCSSPRPVSSLAELEAACGCVDRYCEECRTKPAYEDERGRSLSMADWLVSFGRMHRDQGGRYGGGKPEHLKPFPCPSRWNDPGVLEFVRGLRGGWDVLWELK